VVFKAANKSTIWYDSRAFQSAKVEPPDTWDQFEQVAAAIKLGGQAPMAVGGGNQFVLTDWFENIYLRLAGQAKYDDLAQHRISWNDPSVRQALVMLTRFWGTPGNLAANAATNTWQQSVEQVFRASKAAMVFEGDFLTGTVGELVGTTRLGDAARIFPFPSINGSERSVVVGGDTAVMTRNTTGAAKLMQYLASPRSARIWAAQGGLVSPSKGVDAEVYPDVVSRRSAEDLRLAKVVAFDLSDQLPPQLGSTEGEGLRSALADLLRTPRAGTGQAIKDKMNILEISADNADDRPPTCPGR
jgi:alpha-glucoside transport system substrate-binding protein